MSAPLLPPGRLIWVDLPRACCGLIVAGGIVVAAAPYLRQFVGIDERTAAARLRARGAALVAVDS
jgi:hypothetical protein